MKIIISPAKKMNGNTDSFECHSLPYFLSQSEQLLAQLRSMSYEELKSLWKCSDSIARQNVERIERMDLRRNLTPAILAYEGIQYQHMAPGVFSAQALAYIQDHLRILSGFYGILRPFDGVTPYRLEMQAKLAVGEKEDLYAFWGDLIAKALFSDTDLVVDLASKEYRQCISPYVPAEGRLLTCVFGEWTGNKIIEKGTMCKMARGEMVRFMAEAQIEDKEGLQSFHALGFHFSLEHSEENIYVFLKERNARLTSSL